jgi:glycosyltransferase involved in cell wall biosynthesis
MSNQKPYMLSIAIPTYNRAMILSHNLSTWIQEKDFDKIQLVISDNASTDGTSEIVQKFQRERPNIKYERNAENIGLEANIKQVIELSDGEFIKVMNDYTGIEKWKLSSLLEYVTQNREKKPNLFFWNHPNVASVIRCNSLNELVEKVSYWSTWLSCFGIWKSDYETIPDKARHFGFLFYHTSILFDLASKKETLIFQENFFTSLVPENKGGYHLLVFLDGYFSLLVKRQYKQGLIHHSVYKKEKKALLNFLFPYIVGATIKKNNHFDKTGIFKNLFSYYNMNYYLYLYVLKYLLYAVVYKIKKLIR